MVKVKKKKNGTCAIQLKMLDSIRMNLFRILATWQNTFKQKGYTHTDTRTLGHTDTRRHGRTDTRRDRGAMTVGKICNRTEEER